MTSSSMPTVHGLAAALLFQRAHMGVPTSGIWLKASPANGLPALYRRLSRGGQESPGGRT